MQDRSGSNRPPRRSVTNVSNRLRHGPERSGSFSFNRHIELGRIELVGTSRRPYVVFDITVDGIPAAGQGVMTQRELNSLALSLFARRAMMRESPRRLKTNGSRSSFSVPANHSRGSQIHVFRRNASGRVPSNSRRFCPPRLTELGKYHRGVGHSLLTRGYCRPGRLKRPDNLPRIDFGLCKWMVQQAFAFEPLVKFSIAVERSEVDEAKVKTEAVDCKTLSRGPVRPRAPAG